MFKFKTYAKVEVVSDNDGVLKKDFAGHVDVPDDAPFDLMFFKAIYLTSGSNLNCTHFDKGELAKSINTVSNKAMDIEHEEQGIVGHIYAASFFEANSDKELETDSVGSFDGKVDVVIAGVVYKDRFPELAKEITKGEWFVSMETYYEAFDIIVGEMLIDYDTALLFGITDLIGSDIVLKKADKVLTTGVVSKVVRNLHFSGGGFVKTPANPTSAILDTSDSKIIEISAIPTVKGSSNTDSNIEEAMLLANSVICKYEEAYMSRSYLELVEDVESLIDDISKTL